MRPFLVVFVAVWLILLAWGHTGICFLMVVALMFAQMRRKHCSGKKLRASFQSDPRHAVGSWGHEFAHRGGFRKYGLSASVLGQYATSLPSDSGAKRNPRKLHGLQVGAAAGAAYQRLYYQREGIKKPGWLGDCESKSDKAILKFYSSWPGAMSTSQARSTAESYVRSNYGHITRLAKRKAKA